MSLLLASTSHYIGIFLDIAVLVVLITFACIGYYHGLFKSLIALFSTVVVLIISFYFANHFAKLINTMFDFTSLIANHLAPAIGKLGPVYTMTFPTGMSGSEFYKSYIANSDTNSLLKKFFEFTLKGYKAESLDGLQVADVLAGAISSIIVTVVAGILLFIIIKIALGLLSRFFDNITKLRVLGGLNKIFGFVFGACKGGLIILFFVVITVCLSFVPKVNKKIYPLINDDTKVVKLFYNTTDTLMEKYFVKTDALSKWINNLWDSRDLDKNSKILDNAIEINNETFSLETDGSYKLNLINQTLSTSNVYFNIHKLEDLKSFEKINVTVTIEYESNELVNFQMYSIDDVEKVLNKDAGTNSKQISYSNITNNNLILSLNTTSGEINANITLIVTGVAN